MKFSFPNLSLFPFLFLVFCSVSPTPVFAQDSSTGRTGSSLFTLRSHTPDSIVLVWDRSEKETDFTLCTLLFAPGGIDAATAAVTHFSWRLQKAGGPVLEGEENAFPPEGNSLSLPTVALREAGYLGGCRLAAVTLSFPHSFDTGAGRLDFPRGTIEVRFPDKQLPSVTLGELPSGDGSSPSTPSQAFSGFSQAMDRIARRCVLNYPPVRMDQTAPPAISPGSHLVKPLAKIQTKTEGVVQLAAEEILSLSPEISVETLALYQEKSPIPFQVLDERNTLKSEGRLSSGDRVRFYAPRSDSPYSPETVTWIGADPNRRLSVVEAVSTVPADAPVRLRQTLHLEQDLLFVEPHGKNEEQSEYWMWHDFISDGSRTVSFSLPNVPSLRPVTLTVSALAEPDSLSPATAPLSLKLDDRMLNGETTRTKSGRYTVIASLPEDLVSSATHSLLLSLPPGNASPQASVKLYLDHIDLLYETGAFASVHPFRVQNEKGRIDVPADVPWVWWVNNRGQSPQDVRVSPAVSGFVGRPEEPGEWRMYCLSNAVVPSVTAEGVLPAGERTLSVAGDPSSGPLCFANDIQADVVLVSPRAWIPDLNPYERSLRQKGFRVFIAAVEDIYDLFGDGRPSPHTLKRFLKHAFWNWQKPAPSYVLLVGDATWDYWGRYGNGIENVIPAYRADGAYAVENWYARLDRDDDPVPDLIVARWPVRSRQELAVVVGKTVGYKAGPPPGDWLNQVFLLTDDGFENYSEELAERWIPQGFRLTQRHIADYPLIDNIYLPASLRASLRAKTSLAATEDIVSIVNRGILIWEYFGHGAPNVIGDERMFFGGGSKFSDVRKLNNHQKLPFLWAFTCETATFDYPREKWNISIGEDLLIHPDGGIIALLGATGRGYPHEHILLARTLHQAAFQYSFATLGEAYLAACLLGLAQQPHFEPVDQFALLGDPTLPLPVVRDVTGTVTAADSGWNYEWNVSSEPAASWKTWIQTARNSIADATHSAPSGSLSGSVTLPVLPFDRVVRLGVDQAAIEEGAVQIWHGALPLPEDLSARPIVPSASDRRPDLQFVPGSLTVQPERPRSGETLFLTARVVNQGIASVTEVAVRAFDGSPKGKPLETAVGKPGARIARIDPGEEKEIRVRWDPTDNAGPHELFLVLDPSDVSREEEPRILSATVRVLRKADLVVDASRFQAVPAEGNRLQFSFDVLNQGESPADRIVIELRAKMPGQEEASAIRIPKAISLAPGERYTAGGIKLPAALQSLEILVDPDELVDEETHENNVFQYSHP